jgi:signal peptidase
MKLIKKIATILGTIVIFGIVPVVLFIFLTSRTSVLFGFRSYTVMTGSMRPTLPVGSMVFTRPQATYNIGDIITFNRGNITITHRIIAKEGPSFVTKGDANNAADVQKVLARDIIGKDIAIVPFIGRVAGFIKTPLGFGLLLGLPTLLFVFLEALQIKKEWEKIIEKRIIAKMNTQTPLVTPQL